MLEKLVRFALVAALALAVPLQGVLAAGAGECHHEHATGDAVHDRSSHSAKLEASASDQGGGESHCDPCVACCASASIAGWAAPVTATELHQAVIVGAAGSVAFASLGRLDRPPLGY